MMKPTANRIEHWLSGIEARLIPPQPERKGLRVIVYEALKDRERVFAEKFPGRTVEGINWSDDVAAAQAKALAEHIAAHPEDAGRTVADFRWAVWKIMLRPQELTEDELIEERIEGEHIAEDPDKDTAVSETPDLNVLPPPGPGCLARSKPWRPVHQRPARDQRRPTWKKWER